ncbi:MAG: hypothetical protein CBC01_09080 [Betaproteobacteria bacterium TMED41]|nr:MAG: hypothetical protein CBC01_09080 [Betaproteobacteria bacterium TMED41]|tara:strand:- start:205 stop:615 length:411 start_codon:yes stop_codon:yes gene_type:complete
MTIENSEFKIFKLNIIKVSIVYSFFLIIWGIVISYLSESESLTSFIPSLFGFFILIFAVMSILMPKKQKIFMHIVVIFGLVIFIAGADIFLKFFEGNDPFLNYWAGITRLMFFITGIIFTMLCIQSFRYARKKNSS